MSPRWLRSFELAKFPGPPAALPPAQTVIVASGTLLWRIYSAGGSYPCAWNAFRYFGPTASRFDHHVPPAAVSARGILYASSGGQAILTCIAEVFQTKRFIDRTTNGPRLAAFSTTRDLTLLDLTGTWPTQAGASTAIASGPRPRARAWSRAIYDAFPTVDGLLYGSSMNANQPAYALYERAATALSLTPTADRALDDAALTTRLAAAAGALNYRL